MNVCSGRVRRIVRQEAQPQVVVTFRVVHVPEPENYAHAQLETCRDGVVLQRGQEKEVKGKIKAKWREAADGQVWVVREASRSAATILLTYLEARRALHGPPPNLPPAGGSAAASAAGPPRFPPGGVTSTRS